MANIWNKEKTRQAGEALVKAALEAGGSLTYGQGWEKVKARKNKEPVTGIIGSYATYDKVVKGLLDRATFIRDRDPKDKRVTILRLRDAKEAEAGLQFQETVDQIKGLVEQPSFPISHEEWSSYHATIGRGRPHGRLTEKEDEALWKHPYLIQHQKVHELVNISHILLFKMWPKPRYDSAHYDGAYVSTHGGEITVLSRSAHDNLVDCDRMLRKILEEGKKDPNKEMWLKELGAYQLYLSHRTSEAARAN